jgi:hypothetical protein
VAPCSASQPVALRREELKEHFRHGPLRSPTLATKASLGWGTQNKDDWGELQILPFDYWGLGVMRTNLSDTVDQLVRSQWARLLLVLVK